MRDWGDDVLRHKYDPLPEEPRHKKRAKRKRHVKSDHKHEYEPVAIECEQESHVYMRDGKHVAWHSATRCKVCGRIESMRTCAFIDEIPEGVPVYRVKDFWGLWNLKYLPDDRKVSDGNQV